MYRKYKPDYSNKPYNRCIDCPHRKEKRCNGPRTSAMQLSRWCEYMRDMKEVNQLTNEYIAKTSGVSINTIERLMAQNFDKDIMRETARLIEDAILGTSMQYPCYLAFAEENNIGDQKLKDAMRDLEQALANNRDYKAALDNIHTSYSAEMQTIRAETQKLVDHMQKELEYLRSENDRKAKIIDKLLDR